jgi:hypothetical protein
MNDLTIVYYTNNEVKENFMKNIQKILLEAAGDIPIISVSHKPIDFGENICVGEIGSSIKNVFKQILIGAKAAKTEYIATVEDDTIYNSSHFEYRCPDKFAFNMHKWSIFTWSDRYSYKPRHVNLAMIAPRQLLIDALEERFAKLDTKDKYWGELGRHENHLGVTIQPTIEFVSKAPILTFNHPEGLGYIAQNTRKRQGILQAYDIPVWGKVADVMKLYNE